MLCEDEEQADVESLATLAPSRRRGSILYGLGMSVSGERANHPDIPRQVNPLRQKEQYGENTELPNRRY